MSLKSCLLILVLVLSASCFAKTFSVMTYNAENLFDTKHDEGKEDWTYMPLETKLKSEEALAYCHSIKNEYYKHSCLTLDWSRSVLRKKVKNLGKVIKAYNRGKGADIIVLQEVENMNALKTLERYGLSGMGYKSLALVEGPDVRGIDVAIMSKFPIVGKAKLHQIDLSSDLIQKRPTRGILEVTFKISGEKLTVLANHWPSQANPDYYREIAAMKMREIAASITDRAVISAGDFNTTDSDEPHGINKWILNKELNPAFEDSFVMSGLEEADLEAPGSHWYRGKWEQLDRVFVLNTYNQVKDRLEPLWETFQIIRKDWMTKEITWKNSSGETIVSDGIPWRFDPVTGEGFSDHLPVVVEFRI